MRFYNRQHVTIGESISTSPIASSINLPMAGCLALAGR